MDLEKIKRLIELAKDQGVAELKIENGDEKYCVKMPYGNSPVMSTLTQAPITEKPAAEFISEVVKKSSPSDGLIEVTSPFVGTFYRSSSPEADPYVSHGGKISPGQVLCIVEAMKIMNEIESEVSGEIVEVCAENETYVEYGQVLFKVRPS